MMYLSSYSIAKPFSALSFSKKIVEFYVKAVTPTMIGESFQIYGAEIT